MRNCEIYDELVYIEEVDFPDMYPFIHLDTLTGMINVVSSFVSTCVSNEGYNIQKKRSQ